MYVETISWDDSYIILITAMLRKMVRGFATGPPKGWASRADTTAVGRAMFEVAEAVPRRQEIDPSLLPRLGTDGSKVYEPFDFSLAAKHVTRRKLQRRPKNDRFDLTGVNPLELWKSPDVLSHFVTSNGKIIPGYVLGTQGKNHKKLAKAIRRARAAGLLSPLHRSVFSMLQM